MIYNETLTLNRDEMIQLLEVLEPFANMDRDGGDLKEVASERGTASDQTIITNKDFRQAKAFLDTIEAARGY